MTERFCTFRVLEHSTPDVPYHHHHLLKDYVKQGAIAGSQGSVCAG